MRDKPSIVGVDAMIILRFQNVVVRFVASAMGSPSVPAEAGYLSHSSTSNILIGLLAKPLAELAPTIVM